MPRLPTREEAEEMAEWRLSELCCDVFPDQDPTRLFEAVASHLQVPNDVSFKIEISTACAVYRHHTFDLPPDAIKEARRLVKLIHTQVSVIDALRQKYGNFFSQHRGCLDRASTGFGRKALQPFRDFLAFCDQLEALSGSPPATSLAEVCDCISWVKLKLSPPLSSCRSDQALRDLDRLLQNWPAVTRSTKGKRVSDKALDELILRLSRCYEGLTGKAPDTGMRFRGFVEIVVHHLPETQRTVRDEKDQNSLKKKIERVLRAPARPGPFDYSF